jgi:flagellar biosynthesis protein FlhF
VPLKTYRGASVAPLLARAQAELGPDAVVIRVEGRGGELELVAADAVSAQSMLLATAGGRGRTGGSAGGATADREPPRESELPAALDRAPRAGRPHLLAFVGPTGAGKTTTVAKLAAHSRVFAGRKVGLLNLDTYRVGAAEQLAAYAGLEQLPIATAYEPSDLGNAWETLKGCDVVLVDCPGRGLRAQRDQHVVRDILRTLAPAETHLVLPVGMQPELVRRTIEYHRKLGVTHLLASKVDEMPDDWILFNIAAELRLPMRWLTDGQRVPQDIRAATARLGAAEACARTRPTYRRESVA